MDQVSRNLGHGKAIKSFREFDDAGFRRLSDDMVQYMEYVQRMRKQLDGGNTGPEESDDGEDGSKAPLITFDADGMPLLPPRRIGKMGRENCNDLIPIVRNYFTAHWGKFLFLSPIPVLTCFSRTGIRVEGCKSSLGEDFKVSR